MIPLPPEMLEWIENRASINEELLSILAEGGTARMTEADWAEIRQRHRAKAQERKVRQAG